MAETSNTNATPTFTGTGPIPAGQLVSLCRDTDCPKCGYPETYAEVVFSDPTPGARAIGCRKCGWRVEVQS